MASNEATFHRRSFKRTASETVNRDEENASNRSFRRSESYNVTGDLEHIVTCSIHLGIMDDPRKFSCQHSACYECLKEYVKRTVELICPICRVKEKISDIDKLPSALTEKQLIEVVMKRRLNKYLDDCNDTLPLSEDKKEELVKHMLKELNSSNGIYKVSEENNDITFRPSSNQATTLLDSRHDGSSTSLAYDMMDIEAMRENMLKHSKYEVVKRHAVQKIYKQLNKTENIPWNFSLFDIAVNSHYPWSQQLVIVDCFTNKFIMFINCDFRTFHILVDGHKVTPAYVRIIKNHLLVTGRFEFDGTIKSVFLQCNFDGELIHHYIINELAEVKDVPSMLGFDFNKKENLFYVCMSQNKSVNIFDNMLLESGESIELDENKPEYIAFCSAHNQLWISCPDNKCILIYDIDCRVFRTFNTEQISKAIPKMIYIAEDEKILFLDSRGNRLIWIKRRNEYILTQKINILSIHQDVQIKAFQVLPSSMIIIGSDKEALLFQSKRYGSRPRRFLDSCSVS